MNHELYALREKIGVVLKVSKEPRYVTDLSRNDVLLGRGAFAINYVGNVKCVESAKTNTIQLIEGDARLKSPKRF